MSPSNRLPKTRFTSRSTSALILGLCLASGLIHGWNAHADSGWFAATVKRPIHLASGHAWLTGDGRIHESRRAGACEISVRQLLADGAYDRLAAGVNARAALATEGKWLGPLPLRNRSRQLGGVTLLAGTTVRAGSVERAAGAKFDAPLESFSMNASHSVRVDCPGLTVGQATAVLEHYFQVSRPERGVGLDQPVRIAIASAEDPRQSTSTRQKQADSSTQQKTQKAKPAARRAQSAR
jgi:hypothetical protein